MSKKNKIITILLIVIICVIILSCIAVINASLRTKKLESTNSNVRNELLEERNRMTEKWENNTLNVDIDVDTEVSQEEMDAWNEKVQKAKANQVEKDNKILDIVNKYYPEKMQEIYNELNGKSIYDENKELAYKFISIIIDILDTKAPLEEERNFMIEYINNARYSVKENQELNKKIERILNK